MSIGHWKILLNNSQQHIESVFWYTDTSATGFFIKGKLQKYTPYCTVLLHS